MPGPNYPRRSEHRLRSLSAKGRPTYRRSLHVAQPVVPAAAFRGGATLRLIMGSSAEMKLRTAQADRNSLGLDWGAAGMRHPNVARWHWLYHHIDGLRSGGMVDNPNTGGRGDNGMLFPAFERDPDSTSNRLCYGLEWPVLII